MRPPNGGVNKKVTILDYLYQIMLLLRKLLKTGKSNMINLNYEYKLKPTKKQIETIENTLEKCRNVGNYALRERIDWYEGRKCQVNACSIEKECIMTEPPSYFSQCKNLTQARTKIPELKAVSSVALQQTLKNLDKAFKIVLS